MRSRGREIAHDAIHEGMTEHEIATAIDAAIKECTAAAKVLEQPDECVVQLGLGNVDINSPAFKKAWEVWLYCTDIVQFDRGIALRTAIENYLANSPERESSLVVDALKDAIENTKIRLQGGFVDERLRAYLSGLCEEVGYGNVMASVSRLWRDKDPIGSFACGMCYGTEESAIKKLQAALSEIEVGSES